MSRNSHQLHVPPFSAPLQTVFVACLWSFACSPLHHCGVGFDCLVSGIYPLRILIKTLFVKLSLSCFLVSVSQRLCFKCSCSSAPFNMSHRFSRTEKGKWEAGSLRVTRSNLPWKRLRLVKESKTPANKKPEEIVGMMAGIGAWNSIGEMKIDTVGYPLLDATPLTEMVSVFRIQETLEGLTILLLENRDSYSRRSQGNFSIVAARGESQRSHNASEVNTPPPLPPRENLVANPAPQEGTREITPQGSGRVGSGSRERRPALERLSLPSQEPYYHQNVEETNEPSQLLQDVEIRYLEEEMDGFPATNSAGRRRGSDIAGPSAGPSVVFQAQEDSFPSQLERVHTSLRLGPVPPTLTKKQTKPKTQAKKGGSKAKPKPAPKRRLPRATIITRGTKSPLQGTSIRKLIATRSTNPPRKRLCGDNGILTTSASILPGSSSNPADTTIPEEEQAFNPVPTSCKAAVDFQSPPNPLP
ncbi:unnamed protein product [Arabidopsis arenosa]|uniref:Uncharacterized protein n=1 Tax=Arabidopsis arenosa TaxID=38785 RepID=A0A8S2B5R1_ARAAE|nr:unnamed protein product [Arabidopsis arenosa]